MDRRPRPGQSSESHREAGSRRETGSRRESWWRTNRILVALLTVAVLGLAYAGYTVVRAVTRPVSPAAENLPDPLGSPAPSPTSSRPAPKPSPSTPGARPTRSAAAPPLLVGFPNGSNTGVPAGTRLVRYTGPCTITTANLVIEAKEVRCKVVVKAKGVVIRRSLVLGPVDSSTNGSLLIEDSEVNAGTAYEPAVGYRNVTVRRGNIHGGQASVNCHTNCLIQDSWLHGQYLPPDGQWHLDAFLSNGGSNVQIIHNTLACDAKENAVGGGCTANAAVFGDFGPLNGYTFDRNLFVASTEMPYCFYGGTEPQKPYGSQTQAIVVTNNVFQRGSNGKCAYYGPDTSFDPSRPGNRWSNNVWDDGTPSSPS
ncbi:MAG TPA: hypothetical protein VF163_01485 [Micromonosporaceae bacterium]